MERLNNDFRKIKTMKSFNSGFNTINFLMARTRFAEPVPVKRPRHSTIIFNIVIYSKTKFGYASDKTLINEIYLRIAECFVQMDVAIVSNISPLAIGYRKNVDFNMCAPKCTVVCTAFKSNDFNIGLDAPHSTQRNAKSNKLGIT